MHYRHPVYLGIMLYLYMGNEISEMNYKHIYLFMETFWVKNNFNSEVRENLSNIGEIDVIVVKIVLGRNCVLRFLAYYLFNSQENHQKVRESILQVLQVELFSTSMASRFSTIEGYRVS